MVKIWAGLITAISLGILSSPAIAQPLPVPKALDQSDCQSLSGYDRNLQSSPETVTHLIEVLPQLLQRQSSLSYQPYWQCRLAALALKLAAQNQPASVDALLLQLTPGLVRAATLMDLASQFGQRGDRQRAEKFLAQVLQEEEAQLLVFQYYPPEYREKLSQDAKLQLALVQAQVAGKWLELGQPEAAMKLWNQSLQTVQRLKLERGVKRFSLVSLRPESHATLLARIAAQAIALKQVQPGTALFQRAIQLAPTPQDGAEIRVEILRTIADQQQRAGLREAALATLELALKTTDAMSIQFSGSKAKLLARLALQQGQWGQADQAQANFARATDSIQQLPPALQAVTVAQVTQLYAEAGQWDAALSLARSLTARTDAERRDQAKAIAAIAGQAWAQGQQIQAGQWFDEAWQKTQEIQIGDLQAFTAVELSEQLASAGQIDRLLQLNSWIEPGYANKLTYLDWAQLWYITAGQRQRAQQVAQKTATLITASEQLKQGIGQFRAGEYEVARQTWQQSLQSYQKIQDLQGMRATLASLGDLDVQQKSWLAAIASYQASLKLAQQLKQVQAEATVLTALGYAYLSSGDATQAIPLLQTGLDRWQSIRKRGSYSYKTQLFNQSLAYSWLQRALIQKQQIQAALEVAEQNRSRSLAEAIAARLNSAQTSAESAAPPSSPTVQEMQQLAKELQLTLVQYSILYQPPAILGEYSRLHSQERLKLSSLEQILQQPALPDAASVLQKLSLEDRKSLIQLFQVKSESDLLPQLQPTELRKLLEQLQQKPEENFQQAKTLLIWVVTPTGKVVLKEATVPAVALTTQTQQSEVRDPLEQLVRVSRQAIGVRDRGLAFVENAATVTRVTSSNRQDSKNYAYSRQLHQILIEPIAELLPKNPEAKILLIPQGPLFFAPFASLLDAQDRYLIERHTLLISPSVQVLQLSRQLQKKRQPKTGNVLVVGNPQMPQVRFQNLDQPLPLSTLPGAETEAQEIARLLKTQPLIGSQATEPVVAQRMQQARMIHFATHGLLDNFVRSISLEPQNGVTNSLELATDEAMAGLELGAIALTPGRKDIVAVQYPQGQEDGLLTSGEVSQMQLQADLVVLSACNTGQGRITGESVVGLSQAFMMAGASNLVVSLWAVPDAPTAFLMTTFYKNLQQTGNKAQSLRQAMLQTLKEHPDPVDWAAFLLIGAGE